MTHHTDAERTLSNLRHLYSQMTGGLVKDSAQAKRIAEGLLSPAIARLEQAARRAPAAPVPQYEPVAYLWQHCETDRTRVVMPDMVITADANWIVVGPLYLAAAPQPPEAAPVKLPEPVAKVEDGGLKWHIPDSGYSLPVRYLQGTHKLYTEQQVRHLLAAHGIGKDKA